jgi:chromosome segregation ATPase
MAKAKPVIKAAALSKTLDTHADSLHTASSHAATAVTAKTAEAKKLTTDVKRHTKKKATLYKRIKTATARLRKDASAANKKAAATVTKEYNAIKAALDKSRAHKALVAAELTALKAASKRLNAYTKAVAAADKVLNKPVKKKRKAIKKSR